MIFLSMIIFHTLTPTYIHTTYKNSPRLPTTPLGNTVPAFHPQDPCAAHSHFASEGYPGSENHDCLISPSSNSQEIFKFNTIPLRTCQQFQYVTVFE